MDKVKFTNGTVLKGKLRYGVGIYDRYLFLDALGRENIVGWFNDDELMLSNGVKWIKPKGGVKQYSNNSFIVRALVPHHLPRTRAKLSVVLRDNFSDKELRAMVAYLKSKGIT